MKFLLLYAFKRNLGQLPVDQTVRKVTYDVNTIVVVEVEGKLAVQKTLLCCSCNLSLSRSMSGTV